MKFLLRLLALVLLMLVALVTVSRQEGSSVLIAFSSERNGHPAIYLMTLDGRSQRQVTHLPDCGSIPRWSPDARILMYYDPCSGDQKFMRMRPGEAIPPTLAEIPNAEWSPDGQWLAIRNESNDFAILNLTNGSEMLLGSNYYRPNWSPDGEWLYAFFFAVSGYRLDRIHAQTGHVEELFSANSSVSTTSWSPDGTRLVLSLPTMSDDELFLYLPGSGNLQALSADLLPWSVLDPLWSPDGEWIYFFGKESVTDWRIYRIRPDGSEFQPISEIFSTLRDLTWSEGWLLFEANDGPNVDIYRIRADGSSLQRLTDAPGRDYEAQAASVSGLDWHPLWLMAAAVGIILLSLMGRLHR